LPDFGIFIVQIGYSRSGCLHPSRAASRPPQDEDNRVRDIVLAARFLFAPEFLASHCTKAAPNKIRGAERREAPSPETAPALRMSASEPAASAARATDESRYRGHPLCGARSPFGAPSRHSPGCYPWLSFGPRFPAIRSSLRCRKPR
jgi:hypothetical protein